MATKHESESGGGVGSSVGLCRICGKKHPHEEIRNLNIYAFGSEGVNICHSCEMSVVEFLRAMSGVGSRARLQGYRTSQEAVRHNDPGERPGATTKKETNAN